MMVVLGGLIFQPLVGVLELMSSDNLHKGLKHGITTYSRFTYQISLIIIPICFLIGLVISLFFIKETHGNEYL